MDTLVYNHHDMGKTIKALFKSGDDGRLLGAIEEAVMENWGPGTEDDMSPEIRVFVLVNSAAGSADNGGLEAYLNETLEDFGETVAAFATIGATGSVAYLQRVASVFPGGKLPPEAERPPEQKEFLGRGGCEIFPCDVLPELAAWVRARPKAFLNLPETDLSEMFTPDPLLKPPPSDAGSEDVAEWLHSRGVTLSCVEVRYENGVPRLLFPGKGLPDGPLTLLSVSFSYKQRDNPDTLARLARWIGRGSIEEIRLGDCRLGGAELALIGSFPSLRKLDLRSARFPGRGLQDLAAAKTIQDLSLRGVSITDEDLRPLALMPDLQTLDVVATRIQGSALALFTGLRSLVLGYSPIDDKSLSFLECLGTLASFSIAGVPLNAKAIAAAASRPHLQELDLRDCKLDEAALEPLRGHPSLRSLTLQGMTLTPASARLLAEIPRLETLRIGDKPREMLALLRELRPTLEVPE